MQGEICKSGYEERMPEKRASVALGCCLRRRARALGRTGQRCTVGEKAAGKANVSRETFACDLRIPEHGTARVAIRRVNLV